MSSREWSKIGRFIKSYGVIVVIFGFVLVMMRTSSDVMKSSLEYVSVMKRFDASTLLSKPHSAITSTTNEDVPSLFKDELLKRATIDEELTDRYPAEPAVDKMEKEVGWDPETSNFIHPEPLAALLPGINGELLPADTDPISLLDLQGKKHLYELVDIVIPSIRDLDFLNIWKPYIEDFHLILVQDGDPSKHLKIPEWADYELYNRNDIEKALGDRAWIISKKDASIRNFGFLVSDKRIVYTLDDDCLPATDPSGKKVDSIRSHIYNILSPSNPYFFNTIYDPYRPGSDFVRGYPYSMRGGVKTAVSHGLWMNAYDYDAPTQLLKVTERNTHYVDITQTIPAGVLYPMCSMNVAFDRELIGPAFMQGLMGEGQPWARYDDMFCGWASKVVGDHIGVGTKSGAPYIHHNKASNPFTNLKKEYMGLFWQEEVIKFMKSVELSPENNNAATAYRELAEKVKLELSHLSVYFNRLGDAMKTWVDIWEERNIPHQKGGNIAPLIQFKASRSSIAPKDPSACAIFTVTHNEKLMLPIWLRYYMKHANPEDIWVLDHNTSDGSTDSIPDGVHLIKLHGETHFMPHDFLNRNVELHQQRLLRAGYSCVLFTEIDEMVVPDPDLYPDGLRGYLQAFSKDSNKKYVRTAGYEIVPKAEATNGDIEPDMDWSKSILSQRHFWFRAQMYDKPLLTKVPLTYIPGFHENISPPDISVDPDLRLVHLHSADSKMCFEREYNKFIGAKDMIPREKAAGFGVHFSNFEELKAEKRVCNSKLYDLLKNAPLDRKPREYGKSYEDKWEMGQGTTIGEKWASVNI